MEKNFRTEMLPGKRDFYRCCKVRRSATYTYIIGERAKRARHSQVCSIENRIYIY